LQHLDEAKDLHKGDHEVNFEVVSGQLGQPLKSYEQLQKALSIKSSEDVEMLEEAKGGL